jgi:hypothetical protein
MTRVVLDAQALSQWNGLTGVVEICDEEGNLIGTASPVAGDYSELEIPVTEAEIATLRAGSRGRPLKEILADLEAGE